MIPRAVAIPHALQCSAKASLGRNASLSQGNPLVDLLVAFFLSMDVLAALLTTVIALFFYRTSRALPGMGFNVVALAFGVAGVSYLTRASYLFGIGPESLVLDTARAGGVLLGTLLLFLHYLFRRMGRPQLATRLLAMGGAVVALFFAFLYIATPPRWGFAQVDTYLPWLRLLEFALLLPTALFVAMEVRPKTFNEALVPAGFLFLALDRYTTALMLLNGPAFEATFAGDLLDLIFAYVWRLAGLLLLLAALIPFWSVPDAKT